MFPWCSFPPWVSERAGNTTPWTGFFHFYASKINYWVAIKDLFQRPERASFISTRTGRLYFKHNKWFQRPERASFISTKEPSQKRTLIILCFNALNGLLSFLRKSLESELAKMLCFNALNGLLSFLRFSYVDEDYWFFGCFNALNGLLSFLLQGILQNIIKTNPVSTPWTGFFHFYVPVVDRGKYNTERFQRPERASFIST